SLEGRPQVGGRPWFSDRHTEKADRSIISPSPRSDRRKQRLNCKSDLEDRANLVTGLDQSEAERTCQARVDRTKTGEHRAERDDFLLSGARVSKSETKI